MRRVPFLAGVVLSLTALAGAAALGWRRERDRALEAFQLRAAALTAEVARELEAAVRAGREDLLMLARAPATLDGIEGRETAARLEELFFAYTGTRREVFQVRLLDLDGQERVRVERDGDRLRVAGALQDKSDRPYFSGAQGLGEGQVLVSQIDLNVEFGRVELPPRPTLRFSTPVFDRAGRRSGVLVLNRDAAPLVGRVAAARGRLPGTLILVDEAGVYLSHPDPSREWGASDMLATGRSLVEDLPAVAAWLLEGAGRSAVRRSAGLITAVAPCQGVGRSPRVLLLTEVSAALAWQARELLPFALALLGASLCTALALLGWYRHRRLEGELEREKTLRREIAIREERLVSTHERLVAMARLAALTESSAALAHELRNPLAAIVHSGQLLRRAPGMDGDHRSLLEIVITECERLERTVSEFLAMARPPARRREPIELGRTVHEVTALARHDPALGEAVEIAEELGTSPLVARADPDEVRQVLWNLVLNAGAATRRAGGRRILVRLGARSEGAPAAIIDVEDEGAGPPSDETSLEGPAGRGSGLGLIVAAGIVARCGGRLDITARASGRGARARVILPLAESEEERIWPAS